MKLKKSPFYFAVLSFAFMTSIAFGDVKNYFDADDLTTDQQSQKKNDVAITREIRQDIIADRDLSLYAHNVKIITSEGHVTLRGPVRSREEESKVVRIAQSVAGPRVIDNLKINESKKTATNMRRFL